MWIRLTVLVLTCGFAAGCASVPDATTPPVEAEPLDFARGDVPEDKLLNLWIERFEHEPVESEEMKETGTNAEIRKSEARFIPVHLKNTLQASGHWGAVRVVPPEGMPGGEVVVSGTIASSNGREMKLAITAKDAMGQVWLEKTYSSKAVPANYDRLLAGEWDAFQPLYNEIANDLIEALQERSVEEARRIRQAAELKFAGFVAPEPFADYYETDAKGRVEIQRLPAENDPLYQRVESLKARNDMLADVLNTRYNQFYDRMWDSYTGWRRNSLNEILARERIEQEAAAKKFGGIAAIVGAIALGAAGGEVGDRTGALQTVMIAGGALAISSGISQGREVELHEAAISELGNSFSSEIEPMVVDMDGETVELTGSAEAQFERWRELLRARYEAERGLDESAPAPAEAGTDTTAETPVSDSPSLFE